MAKNVSSVLVTVLHPDVLGKYSKRRERASRNGSTVVDIFIPPPSFKPVSLSLSRSRYSKTPKQVFFLTQ